MNRPRLVISCLTMVVVCCLLSVIVGMTIDNFGHQMPGTIKLVLSTCYFVGTGMLGWMLLDWCKERNNR